MSSTVKPTPARRKTTKKSTKRRTAQPVTKVPQPNGRGALNSGGTPGNRGGTGRPPNEVRDQCRGSFEQRIHVAERIADDSKASAADRLRALDLLAKYGLGTTTTATNTKGEDAPPAIVIREAVE